MKEAKQFTEGVHYSKGVEYAVLGACLMENTGTGRTYGILKPEYFYNSDSQKIYSTLLEMFDESKPIELVSVLQYMQKKGLQFNGGNPAYMLVQITNNVTSTAYLEYYCDLIRGMWKLREIEKIKNAPFDPTEDAVKEIAKFYSKLSAINSEETEQDWLGMEDSLIKLAKHQQDIATGEKTFITSGFKIIDRLNGGFYPGQFIVIGARPATGKSALMNKMALQMAAAGKSVGIISLEMENIQLTARMVSAETGVPFQTIYRNLMQDEAERKKYHSIISNQTAKHKIFISDQANVDINSIKAKAMKLKRKGCDCLFVDYLQLINTDSLKVNNREQEIAKISRGLKILAMELKIPIVALCQLSREIEKRPYPKRFPILADLRESGTIEQNADAVIMLHRDFVAGYTENPTDKSSTEKEADLLGVKWRNGAPFQVKLQFEPETMHFTEASSFFQPKGTIYNPSADDDKPF